MLVNVMQIAPHKKGYYQKNRTEKKRKDEIGRSIKQHHFNINISIFYGILAREFGTTTGRMNL